MELDPGAAKTRLDLVSSCVDGWLLPAAEAEAGAGGGQANARTLRPAAGQD